MQLAVLSTESDAGKTHIVGALSYIFREKKPFPFKAQNMSLNAYLSRDGGEMAFAQAYQAMCAGRAPVREMNPVLLKPMAEHKTEVVLLGKSYGKFSTKEYWFHKKEEIKDMIFDTFLEIQKREKVILVEGAGSCTEINLKESDFANLKLCEKFEIPFVVITDIERGGIFAKIVGTYELLERKEKELLIGFIINKFRGDKSILDDGIKFIERKTGRKVLGIIPYGDFSLPEEDSLGFRREIKSYKILDGNTWLKSGKEKEKKNITQKVRIRVVKTPYLSNFFDFYPLMLEDHVDFDFSYSPSDIEKADIVVLGGSRNVFYDLAFLRTSGISDAIEKLKEEGEKGKRKAIILGICGGFEMFFKEIHDPYKMEIETGKVEGLGFLNGKVIFQREKITRWEKTEVDVPWFSGEVEGFNIRHGVSIPDALFISDGVIAGTFLHNIFFSDELRGALLKYFGVEHTSRFPEKFEEEVRRWSEHIRNNVDIEEIVRYSS